MRKPTTAEGIQITRTINTAAAGKGFQWSHCTAVAHYDSSRSLWRCGITDGAGKGSKATTEDNDPTVKLSNMINAALGL